MTVETLNSPLIELYKIENPGNNMKMFYMLSLILESETNILCRFMTQSEIFLEIWTVCLTDNINPKFSVSENLNPVDKVKWRVVVSHDTGKAMLSL